MADTNKERIKELDEYVQYNEFWLDLEWDDYKLGIYDQQDDRRQTYERLMRWDDKVRAAKNELSALENLENGDE